MALPQLTDEQRAAALEKAAAARRSRAELKAKLKRGGHAQQVLVDAETDEALAKLKVSALLEALPGVGKVRAAALMEQFEIAPSRRVRGLGERQRQALLDEFGVLTAATARLAPIRCPSGEPTSGRANAGRLFVLSGPSGVGKSTVLAAVRPALPGVWYSVSATTRRPRPGEVDGVNYHFVDRRQFDEWVAAGPDAGAGRVRRQPLRHAAGTRSRSDSPPVSTCFWRSRCRAPGRCGRRRAGRGRGADLPGAAVLRGTGPSAGRPGDRGRADQAGPAARPRGPNWRPNPSSTTPW